MIRSPGVSHLDAGISSPFLVVIHVMRVNKHLGRDRSPPVMLRSSLHDDNIFVADWRSCLWVVFSVGV